jgi:hypothetical protein
VEPRPPLFKWVSLVVSVSVPVSVLLCRGVEVRWLEARGPRSEGNGPWQLPGAMSRVTPPPYMKTARSAIGSWQVATSHSCAKVPSSHKRPS